MNEKQTEFLRPAEIAMPNQMDTLSAVNMSATNYPLRHISIRVPWHDNGWNGTVCKSPKFNGACLKLPRIADSRDDGKEQAVAGKSIRDLDVSQWPCCVGERGTFMADFEFTRMARHPYSETSPKTHGHFDATPLRYPPYAAPAVPFLWMRAENMEAKAAEHDLPVDPGREPDLDFETGWVQEMGNQKALVDCFFGHVQPEESLCFFYAKQVPFVEDFGRVIIGVGRVKHVGQSTEYRYKTQGTLRCILWEHMIQHSIRPNFSDGFLMPYHTALEFAAEHPDFDPAEIAAFAPEDRILEFSYASEHVTADGAIAALLSCAAALNKAKTILPGSYGAQLTWLDRELGRLWKLRGPCPGLGAALSAVGLNLGSFIAREIGAKAGDNANPWPLVDQVFKNPKQNLPLNLGAQFNKTICEAWSRMPKERRALLELLSRFELTAEQSKRLFVVEERERDGIAATDRLILENPYSIYELTRLSADPVSVWTVDRGVFPSVIVQSKHPLPEPSAIDGGTDARRIRALMISAVEESALDGNTLVTQKDAILKIRDLPLDPKCEVTGDTIAVAEEAFDGVVSLVKMKDGARAYQLQRLTDMGRLIRETVNKRIAAPRHAINADWRKLLDSHLKSPSGDEEEERARQEKVAALKELAEARFSVLIGPAGTGKTTLLSVLCSHPDIASGGVLLLAPTGKARVRMEQLSASGNLKALTLAQFLNTCGRYNGETFRYQLSDREPMSMGRTIIVDECSMLTEEMLAALLNAVTGVHRLILVGDPKQLPPIGAGRPFVDIVRRLEPENVHKQFPRIATGYAELTIRRRQTGQDRPDLRLAEWFSGRPVEPSDDDVFNEVMKPGGTSHIQFIAWNTAEEFQAKLMEVLTKELRLANLSDSQKFNLSIGATLAGQFTYFNLGSAGKAEAWQILTPVRGLAHGVAQVNRLIHKTFKSPTLEFARQRKNRKIPKPMGSEEIVYGDKVICIQNHRRDGRRVYPQEGAAGYVANGEIGIAVGQWRTPKMTSAPWILKVEFSSQPKFQYDFTAAAFGEESQPLLELAYALTVHKAQGSEFELVILVCPVRADWFQGNFSTQH
jgi:DNA-binding FrmR family transcriptional regulator